MIFFDCLKGDAFFVQGNYKAAFDEYFTGATEYSSSRAACNLAHMYRYGYYVPKNPYMARKFYHAASFTDDGEAHFNLALMKLRGEGGDVDFDAAVEHMRRSAVAGCIDAMLYLGMAYTLGFAYDPIEIECISRIPFYRVIKRKPSELMLSGSSCDSYMDDARYTAIEADENTALEMFDRASKHKDDTYASDQIGSAKFMVGQALIEGFGNDYSPEKGYRILKEAALENGSREAAAYLLAQKERALAYGVNADSVSFLLDESKDNIY